MTTPQSLSFDDTAALLQRLKIPITAPEVHGMLCGLLCSLPSAGAKTRWFTELLDAAEFDASAISGQSTDVRALDSWFVDTLDSMNDVELRYEPLLPDDESAISLRVAALADFCAGFNYGLGIGVSRRGSKSLPADTRELILDFQAIESTEANDATPNDEADFAELAEYVRVGVLLILDELQPAASHGASMAAHPSTSGNHTVH